MSVIFLGKDDTQNEPCINCLIEYPEQQCGHARVLGDSTPEVNVLMIGKPTHIVISHIYPNDIQPTKEDKCKKWIDGELFEKSTYVIVDKCYAKQCPYHLEKIAGA